jgi:hypothetical protein
MAQAGNSRGQIGGLIYGLVFVLVGVIVAVMLQVVLTNSLPNFTAGSIERMILSNIEPLVLVGLMVGVVGLFIGLKMGR